MKRIAFTFIGKDRPGIVAGVSRFLCEAGCNIEDATMTILEEQFAMILVATVPQPSKVDRLTRSFARLKRKWGLDFFAKPLPRASKKRRKHPEGTQTYLISVIGKDRTGIVYETSRILAQKGLNITDLNSRILGRGGRALFAMMMEVDLPRQFKIKRLDPDWKKLKRRMGVEVRVRPLERLAL